MSDINHILEAELLKELEQVAHKKHVKAGEELIQVGERIKRMPIVKSGIIKIFRVDDDGNELFLYYLNPGDVCTMSLTCCMTDKQSEIRAVAEQDSEILMVPIALMEDWIKKYRSWRSFVFDSYSRRFDELLEAINSIAFMKMDERLMKYLLDKKQNTGSYIIHETHQEIATALHTSRVVVSRLLKQLEKQEKVELYRNRIEIL